MSISKELHDKLLNITLLKQKELLLTIPQPPIIPEEIDEFGFIILPPEVIRAKQSERHKIWGCNRNCKSLCKYLPHVGQRQISFKKTGLYYCGTCEIAMKSHRCRCCSRLGRMEPRQRTRLNHPETKFVE